MKIKNRWTILVIAFLILCISLLAKISFSLDNNITSSEYTISNNKIIMNPTNLYLKVRELNKKVSSSFDYNVVDTNNNDLIKSDLIATGYKLKVNNNEYGLIVKGDVTGDGEIDLGDVSKLYNTYKNKVTLTGDYLTAGKVTNNSSVTLGDVSKLYNFYLGKSALTYYSDEYKVETYIKDAKTYYSNNSSSNKIGTNIINELNISDKDASDSIVVTKDGKVEAHFLRNNICLRKYALSDDIDEIETRDCNANISAFTSNGGYLHVSGNKLLDQNNHEVRLKGTTTGIYLDNETQNANHTNDVFFKTMKDWGTNAFRIFIGSKFKDKTNENYEAYFNKLKDIIRLTTENDMYIIINFDPAGYISDATWKDRAEEFFTEMLDIYGNDPHIIYEIWNEPNSTSTWSEVKEYANRVIPVIRNKAPNSIILVGTPNFDKRPDVVVNDPLSFNNIMYTQHMYTPGMTDESVDRLISALDAGLPIFVSEWAGVQGNPPKKGSYIDEAQAMAFARIIGKYNLSFIHFTCGRSVWSYGFINWYDHAWEATYPESILSENALLFKRLLYDDYSSSHFLMDENSSDQGEYYRSSEWKDKIRTVSFSNTINVPSNAVVTWDLSQIKDNSIIGYLKPSSVANMYDLVIAADGIINLPLNSRYLFGGLSNVVSYDFTNTDTNLVYNISYMFRGNTSLQTLDLSSFNTSYLRYMYATFIGDTSLVSINFDGWEPVIEGAYNMFNNCTSLESLDLSHFDMSKVNNFDSMFYNNSSLHTLNISTWSPTNVVSMKNTFRGMSSLESLDLSGFTTFEDNYSYDKIFDSINPSVTIKTGNTDFKNTMKTLYPSLNIQ